MPKNTGLDPVKEGSCADKAHLIAGFRPHKLRDLLQVAGMARSTFYFQTEASQTGRRGKRAVDAVIRAVYDAHKGL